MAISEEELKKIIDPDLEVVEISTVSSDGRTFLTRIPKEIVEELRIEKGNKLKWVLSDKTKKINLEIMRND